MVTSFQGHAPGSSGYRRLTGCLFLAGLATFALLHATQPILPELSDAFGITAAQSTWSLSAATLGIGIALVLAGPLTDMVGRTPLIFGSLFASSAVGIACGFAPNWHLLVLLRTVQGVLLAGLPSTATAYLREEVHPRARLRATGSYIGGTALGGMSGRLICGTMTDWLGWRSGLIALGVLGLLCAIGVFWLLPRSQNFVTQPAQPRAIAARMGRVLTDPALVAMYAIGGTLFGGFVAAYNGLSFRLVAEPYNLSVTLVSFVFLSYAVGSYTSGLGGRLADRFGAATVVLTSILITLSGLALTLAEPLVLVVLGIAVFTGGFFAAHGVTSAWVPARAVHDGGGAGQAASMYLCMYYLGGSAFGSVAGTAWQSGRWPGVALLVGILTVTAAGLAMFARHHVARHNVTA